MNHFLSIHDVTDLKALIKEALEVKKNPYAFEHLGKHKTMCLLFFNSSLRTRLSTQKAAEESEQRTAGRSRKTCPRFAHRDR